MDFYFSSRKSRYLSLGFFWKQWVLPLLFIIGFAINSPVSADTLSETREVIYTGEGVVLADKAAELSTPAAIYEYVRNTHEYALYHGSRSNTINTFLGQRGSDVDIASVLIAMYRSQNIPARYAVGTVSAPASDVANWLGVKNNLLAASIMDNQGIQNVNATTDGSTDVIEFEHAWVQVLVPYDNYRGAYSSTVDCTVTPADCQWINLDPSWKLREFHNQGIDIYNVVNFDYTRYYNALKNDDADYRDKNPLEIYEETILDWLQTNQPGKTLDDVADQGMIIPVTDGILPASLPYKVISTITPFDSVDEHDVDTNQKFWAKKVVMKVKFGAFFNISMGTYYLSDLSTKRLTLTYELGSPNRLVARLDGVETAVPLSVGSLNINGTVVDVGFPFTMTAAMDGAPSTIISEDDNVIDVFYGGFRIGGYYLVGIGGDTSNWSQVHRAADQLLQASIDYPIVFNTSEAGCDITTGFGCTPYVDTNSNGYDISDGRLLDAPEAQDSLTGGLLYVAMSQYFTRFTQSIRELDALNHVISPIEGFIGVLSATYEVDYLGSTTFSVMPGGLLIDMKGQTFGGAFRVDDANTYADEHFELLGHSMSSLEHEIWQELTGFDAISTVRGFQFALGGGDTLTVQNQNLGNGLTLRTTEPSQAINTGFNTFSVSIEKKFVSSTGQISSLSFLIANESFTAGGGWVDGTETLNPSVPNSSIIKPDFNNEVFTEENLVASTNNDLIRTPSTADPVSTVTGNMYHDETDFTIKGRGMPYVLTRSYNSGSGRVDQDSPFGYGWTHSYNMSLRSNDYGKCPSCDNAQATENDNNITSSISYVDERGGEHTYILNADGAGTRSVGSNPPGEFEALTLNDPAVGQHTLTFRNGVKYVFSNASSLLTAPDQTARLDYIEDPYNNRLTMGYDGSNRLVSVTDNLAVTGRTGLAITYVGSTPHIQSISDWSGRTWAYAYDANNNLDSMTNPLSEVMDYTYHPDTHLLNALIKPQNRSGQQASMAFSYYRNNKAFNYVNTLGETETLDYDLYRQRTQVTDPRGFVRTHVYDTDNGALIKMEEPDGAILRFANNADGLRYKKTDGLGYEMQYSYRQDRIITNSASNTGGVVTRETDALGQNTDFQYTIYDQPAITWDKRGNRRINHYHGATDIAAKSVAGKLRREYVDLDSAPQQLSLYFYNADPSQPSYGQLDAIQEIVEPGNFGRRRNIRFFWDSANGIDLVRSERSGTVNGVRTTEKIVTTYTYDTLGRKTSETLHRRLSATNATAELLTTTFEYDALDRIIKTTNPRGDIAETVYDKNGQIHQQKVHYQTTQTRNNCAVPAIVNGNSYVTCTYATNVYDAADRLIQTTDILGHSQTVSYDAIGNISSQTDANGNVTRFEYDAMNRRTAIIDANGHKATLKYDLAGRLVKTTNANGHSVTNQYDAVGRLIKTVTQEGRETELSYDANGNQTHLIDANATANAAHPRNAQNASVYTEYDGLNRPFRVTDALNGQTTTAYDLLGNITSITDAQGQVTQFVYDDLGRLLETIDPIIESGTDKTKKVVVYNEANQPLRTLDRAGVQIDYSYDVLGRLVERYSNSGILEISEYDDFGDLVKQASFTHTYEFAYTSRHKIKQKTDKRSASGDKSLSWQYDAAGNVVSKTDYQNEIINYQYDSTNRLTALQNKDYLQVSYHYDGAGRLLNRILSNGAQTNYKYDHDNRLTELENLSFDPANPAQKQTVEKLVYQRDEVGNITQIDNAAALSTVDYGYDALYRLTSVDSTFNSEDRTYTYDSVGNRKTETKNGSTYFYCYHLTDCSQPPLGSRLHNIRVGSLTGAIHRSFLYDSRGNIESKRDGSGNTLGGWAFNATNQPVWLFDPDGDIRFASYDTAGYRIASRTTNIGGQTETQSRYYMEGEHIEAIYTDIGCPDTQPNGCVTESEEFLLDKKYLRGVVVDEIVNGYDYNIDDGNFNENDWENNTFHHDHLNTVTALTAHDGAVEEINRFDAFGAPLQSVNDNKLLFTGREYDPIQAVYYYRARYYDPEIGRFVSEDPLGFAAGVNFYAYVNNNPVNFNDPMGEDAITLGASFRLFGTGISLGGEVRFPGVSNEPFDIGINGSLTPGFVGEKIIGLLNPGSPFADASQGIDFGRLTLDVGFDTMPRDQGSFIGVEMFAGAPAPTLGGIGVTALFDANQSGSLPVGGQINIGPQLRGGANMQLQGSLTVRDIVDFGVKAIDFIGNQFSGNTAAGGFVLYPSKPNTNVVRQVYAK